jgi:hypothetical protein
MRALLSVILLATVPPLRAQEPPTQLQNMGMMCCKVRVWAKDGQAQGTFQGMTGPSSIMISPCEGSLCPTGAIADSTIALEKNTAVEVYAGRSVEKGVKWGAAVGGLALTFYWLGREDLEQEDAGKVGAGMVLGGVVGAAVGGLIGALFPRWLPVTR